MIPQLPAMSAHSLGSRCPICGRMWGQSWLSDPFVQWALGCYTILPSQDGPLHSHAARLPCMSKESEGWSLVLHVTVSPRSRQRRGLLASVYMSDKIGSLPEVQQRAALISLRIPVLFLLLHVPCFYALLLPPFTPPMLGCCMRLLQAPDVRFLLPLVPAQQLYIE